MICIDSPSLSQCTNHLQNQYTTTNTATTNLPTLLATNANIIIDSKEFSLDTSNTGLLRGHTEVQHIAGIVHRNDQHAIISGDTIDNRSADLLGRRRGKDGTGDRGIAEPVADEACKCGFMAGTATRHDGDLVCSAGRIWTAEYNLVLLVQGQRWVCECKRVKRSENQVVWVGEEMFGWETVRYVGKIWGIRGGAYSALLIKSGQFRLGII